MRKPLDLSVELRQGRLLAVETEPQHWFLVWLPFSETDPDYPGFVIDSSDLPPEALEEGEEGLLGWAMQQEWGSL
jgi:hypothetical protein